MPKSKNFWTNRTPADMHGGDGVHFSEEQLARKKAKEIEKKRLEKEADKKNKS